MKEKKSLKYLIVSACLALLLVSIGGIVVGASENVAPDTDLAISGVSLDLGDKISIVYAVEKEKIADEYGNIVASVSTYSKNPNGTANTGETLTYYIERQMNNKEGVPTDFVFFYSEGFASVHYGETVYARLVHDNGSVGTVVKTSVIELVKGLQAKNEANPTSDRYATKKGLYEAILNYGVKTQAVLTEYPVYNYFTVNDGAYLDDANQKWTSGVVADGTAITMSPSADVGLPMEWNDGTNTYSGNTVTVDVNGASYSPAYVETVYDTNPGIANWTGTPDEWYKYESLLKSAPITPTETASNFATLSYLGNGVIKYEYPFKEYDLTAPLSGNGVLGAGNNNPIRFQNLYATAGSSVTMSFKVQYPELDLNGNGISNEAYGATYTARVDTGELDDYDEPVYEDVTHYINGDFFRAGGNNRMNRFDIGVASTYSGTNTPLVYVNIMAIVSNGIVTGFQVGTANGTGDTTNEKFYNETFDLQDGATVSAEYVLDADGAVTAIKIYVNGELFRTHYASNGQSNDGFNQTADTKHKLAGTGKYTWYGFNVANLGRSLATVAVSDLSSTIKNSFTASELTAYNYGADIESYSDNAILVSNGTQYAWNTIKDLAGVNDFGTYTFASDATKSSWKYDAAKNSVVTTKYNGVTNGQQYVAILIDNPLYGKQATWNGKSAVFEFTFEMQTDDMNEDGHFDRVRDTINSDSSTVWGQLNIGYGDGVAPGTSVGYDTTRSTGGISELNALLGNYRIKKSVNSATAVNNMWTLCYYNQLAECDGGTDFVSRHTGNAVTFRIEVTPDANGVPQKMSFYVDGQYIETRYNREAVAKADNGGSFDYTTFTYYSEDGSTGAYASLFDAPYFEISQWLGSARIGTSEFSNVRSWAQTALH